MDHRRGFEFAGLAFAAEQSAVAYVESLYADRESPGGPAHYSPHTQALWDDCWKREKQTGDACIDFDMIAQGNDAEISDVTVTQQSGDAKQAVVIAKFKNHGDPETVTYTLIHGNDGWAIDEITSGCNVLTTILKGESKC
jgi:hypothetical protein